MQKKSVVRTDLPPLRAYVKNYAIKAILIPIQLSSFQSRVITPVQSDHLLRALIQMFNGKCSSRGADPGSRCVRAAPEHCQHRGFSARDEDKKKPRLEVARKDSQEGHQCGRLEGERRTGVGELSK